MGAIPLFICVRAAVRVSGMAGMPGVAGRGEITGAAFSLAWIQGPLIVWIRRRVPRVWFAWW